MPPDARESPASLTVAPPVGIPRSSTTVPDTLNVGAVSDLKLDSRDRLAGPHRERLRGGGIGGPGIKGREPQGRRRRKAVELERLRARGNDVLARHQAEDAELAEVIRPARRRTEIGGTRLHRSDVHIRQGIAGRIQNAARDGAGLLERDGDHLERLSGHHPECRKLRGIDKGSVSGLLHGEPVGPRFQFGKRIAAILIRDRLQSRPASKGKHHARAGNRRVRAVFEHTAGCVRVWILDLRRSPAPWRESLRG